MRNMDINGSSGINGANGLAQGIDGTVDMPLGLGFGLAMNARAMGAYAALSETEKEHLIMRCRDARSKEEMQRIVDSLVADTDATGVREEEKDSFS